MYERPRFLYFLVYIECVLQSAVFHVLLRIAKISFISPFFLNILLFLLNFFILFIYFSFVFYISMVKCNYRGISVLICVCYVYTYVDNLSLHIYIFNLKILQLIEKALSLFSIVARAAPTEDYSVVSECTSTSQE